ncbi:hypothetical protein LUZ60_001153 [Juncus effusus]|nr:hypothetical protein LUZ60_001153 [Juncus effusus]
MAVSTVISLLLSLSLLPLSLSAPAGSPKSDAAALLLLRDSFTNYTALSSWNENSSPCDKKSPWLGVVCFKGILIGLRMSGLGLHGTIDVNALLYFKGLRSIAFSNNFLSGPLPAFEHLTALKSIYLSNNNFNGTMPDAFFTRLGHLKKLWIDGNQIMGSIPSSVSNATNLIELHMERNKLHGELPLIPPRSLSSFNVSHNEIEGVIPEGFKKFDASSFAGNAFLCREQLPGQLCRKPPISPTSSKNIVIGVILIMVAIICILVALQGFKRNRVRNFDTLGVERDLEYEKVYCSSKVESSNKRRSFNISLRSKRSGSSHNNSSSKGGQDGGGVAGGLATGDLVIVNESKGRFGLTDLMKAAAEVLGNGGIGSAYKAVMANGSVMVVKRITDMNRVAKEVFDMEMRRLGGLRHRNVLPPLAYHYRKEEKLLVYEFIPKGSLLYVLHGDRGMDHAALDWTTRAKIARGIARGMVYLHANLSSMDLPHGNLKSGNVLLSPDFEPLIVDYGFYPLTSPSVTQHCFFAFQSPENVLNGQPVTKKSDVYCLGIVLLELLTGKFPSQYLQNTKGGTDLIAWANNAINESREPELFDPAILEKSKPSLPDMKRLLQIAMECVEPDVETRLDMKEAGSRIEELVADVEKGGTKEETTTQNGDAEPSANSHAAYVRDSAGERSARRAASIGERSARRSDDLSFAIS